MTQYPGAVDDDTSLPPTVDGVTPVDQDTPNGLRAAIIATQTHLDTTKAIADAAIPASEKGANDGVAELDSGGKVPTAQLPTLVIANVTVVADITARDALTPGEGDVAIVEDNGGGDKESFIYDGSVWQAMSSGGVDSINTQTGDVTLDAGDLDYDNGASGLAATNTQAAIDEVEGRVDALEAGSPTNPLQVLIGRPSSDGGYTMSANDNYYGVISGTKNLETGSNNVKMVAAVDIVIEKIIIFVSDNESEGADTCQARILKNTTAQNGIIVDLAGAGTGAKSATGSVSISGGDEFAMRFNTNFSNPGNDNVTVRSWGIAYRVVE